MPNESYLDLLGEGGREHHCLPLPHAGHVVLLHDAADLWLKPHVQHPICLIQHQVTMCEYAHVHACVHECVLLIC